MITAIIVLLAIFVSVMAFVWFNADRIDHEAFLEEHRRYDNKGGKA